MWEAQCTFHLHMIACGSLVCYLIVLVVGADLVFIQNGMIQPWLNKHGLSDNTQVRRLIAGHNWTHKLSFAEYMITGTGTGR